MEESKITVTGETIIPEAIRQHLALRPGDTIRYYIEGNRVILIPARISITELKGILPKPEQAATLEEMDSAIAKAACRTMDSS